jgi:hypothetical protein
MSYDGPWIRAVQCPTDGLRGVPNDDLVIIGQCIGNRSAVRLSADIGTASESDAGMVRPRFRRSVSQMHSGLRTRCAR